jgi:hypothetical protein
MVQAADVDWKFYGFATVDDGTACFYEAAGMIQAPDRHLRVL